MCDFCMPLYISSAATVADTGTFLYGRGGRISEDIFYNVSVFFLQ